MSKIDQDIKPEIAAIYADKHDEKASNYYEEAMQKDADPKLFLKAAQEYEISTNPDGKSMAGLLRAMYFRSRGLNTKNYPKAVKYLNKALKEFEKVDENGDLYKRVELEMLNKKLGDMKKPDPLLFKRCAELSKALGNEKNFHRDMSLYHMDYIMAAHNKMSPEEILDEAEIMIDHARKSENPELSKRLDSFYHQVRSQYLFNEKQAVKELKLAKQAVEDIEDDFRLETLDAEYYMAKALITSNPIQRDELIVKAAQNYQKHGIKTKENFARKMLSPLPPRSAGNIYEADRSLEKLKEIEKKLIEIKSDRKGPALVFYYINYLMERIRDVKRLMLRMAMTRKRLTDLHIKTNALRPQNFKSGKPASKRLIKVQKETAELTNQMRQDMETLFIYGNLLLDQWSYIIGYTAGYEVPDKPKSSPQAYFKNLKDAFADDKTKEELQNFWNKHKNEVENSSFELNFAGLLELLQSKSYNGNLKSFWDIHKKDIIWLNFNLRFFRNVFIEHLRKPWQRGTAMGIYTDEFNLHIPAAAGYIKPEDEKKLLEEIYPLSPQSLRDMPDDYWEKKSLRRVLEVTLSHIDQVEEQSDRQKIWDAWHKLGGSTLSYDIISYRLFKYLSESLETIFKSINQNPSLVKFGEFNNQELPI